MQKNSHLSKQFLRFYMALDILATATQQLHTRQLSSVEILGVLLAFRMTYELAWHSIKKVFEDQGEVYLEDERQIIRLAFRRGFIDDGDTWMDMLKNIDKELAHSIAEKIINAYYPEFIALEKKLSKL